MFNASISISNSYRGNDVILKKNYTETEKFHSDLKLYQNKERNSSFFKAILITIRTNNFKNFCKDFFLPSFFNTALKTRDLATKLILMPICVLIDLSTLIFRILSLGPRMVANNKESKENHPLFKHLVEQGVKPEILKADYVYVEKFWTGPKDQIIHTTELLNFIEMPLFETSICFDHSIIHGANKEERHQLFGSNEVAKKQSKFSMSTVDRETLDKASLVKKPPPDPNDEF